VAESFYRRNLPHWDASGATYFITMCLAGSLPARGWLSPRRTEAQPRHHRQAGQTATTTPGQAFVDYDKRLDTASLVQWFSDPRLARIATDALRWGDRKRYDLVAYVVMPNHVHWVFTMLTTESSLEYPDRLAVTTAFKSYTAVACNRLLGRRGRFWQEESYDRIVRDAEELERIVRYVEHNPVRAGLCERAEEWEFSSAQRRGWRDLPE